MSQQTTISSIEVGSTYPTITFDTPAAIQAAVMSIAGLDVEVSGALYGLPCNEYLELDPNLDRKGPLLIDPNYNHILIVGIIIPKQSGTYASSVFEVSDADALAEELLAPLYPCMKGQCGKFNLGWIHTHPKNGSVYPSTTDVTSFNEKSDGKPIYIKVIINNRLIEPKLNVSEDIFTRVKISGSVYAPVQFNNTPNGLIWSGAIGIQKNPYIKSLTFTSYRTAEGVILRGLEPSSWFVYNPVLYRDIVVSKNSTIKEWKCWGHSELGQVTISGVPVIKDMLKSAYTQQYNDTNSNVRVNTKKSNNHGGAGFKW